MNWDAAVFHDHRRKLPSLSGQLRGLLIHVACRRRVDVRAKPPIEGCVNKEVKQAGLFPTMVGVDPCVCPENCKKKILIMILRKIPVGSGR